MTEEQLKRLEELTGFINRRYYTEPELKEYRNLSELLLDELNLDRVEKRNNRFFHGS